ncbi:hypothetical protein SsS58_07630 [Streptomyces scabiei]|uniref:Uncharacterized protein n=1 Tax=Streptomyces scabiei TaxID=1930 RepID=A0A100JWX4_STRSC|nr:hypothetical protein SsS58_07630 [Streptomyces scabiei]
MSEGRPPWGRPSALSMDGSSGHPHGPCPGQEFTCFRAAEAEVPKPVTRIGRGAPRATGEGLRERPVTREPAL